MRKPLIILMLLAGFCSIAQNCKPDLNTTDKITRKGNIAWQSELFDSNFGNSFINTSDWRLNFQLGRYTENHLLTIFINKYEESAQNASFESQYQGVEGKELILGFSTGAPLIFKVTSAVNNTKMDNLSGRLVTTITLSVLLTPDEIKKIKQSFAAGKLNAVRCYLANNQMMEKDVKEKLADRLSEKVNCFLSYVDQNPITTSAPMVGTTKTLLPVDETTLKVTYSEVIIVDSTTSYQLFSRAKNWMIDFYKDSQIKLELPSEGKLSRTGSFIKVFNVNGKTESNELLYTITLAVKDGKYKYTITDIIDDDGKSKVPAEALNDMLKKIPAATGDSLVQQFNHGFNEIIKQLKTAMQAEKKSDW